MAENMVNYLVPGNSCDEVKPGNATGDTLKFELDNCDVQRAQDGLTSATATTTRRPYFAHVAQAHADHAETSFTLTLTLSNTQLGLGFAAFNVLFESLTSTLQSSCFRDYPYVTKEAFMMRMNLSSLCLAAAFAIFNPQGNEFFGAIAFFEKHPTCLLHVLIFTALSAAGQSFIFGTIKRFGALAFATIMTVRQMFSVFISNYYFGRSFASLQYIGVATVFLSLLLNSYLAMRRKESTAKGKKDDGAGTADHTNTTGDVNKNRNDVEDVELTKIKANGQGKRLD